MTAVSFTIFETMIGACGIAWGERGIVAVQLPEANAHAARVRLRRRSAGAVETPPTQRVKQAVDGITRTLTGPVVRI